MSEASTSKPDAPDQSQKWWIMLGVGLGVLMFALDTSIVNTALPTLVQVFQTDFATVQWVTLSYLLVIAALVLGVGRFGDILGKKRLYLAGLIVFSIGSLLCSLSSEIHWLIGFRALQGLGAVMLSALGAAIVTEAFPSSERGQALGIIGATISFGIALGPTIGGLLVSLSSWRTIFWINVPIGIFAIFVVMRSVSPSVKNSTGQQFDWTGAVIMAVTLSSLTLALTGGQKQGFTHLITLAAIGIAAIGLFSFLWVEARLKQPMLDLRLFDNSRLNLNLLTGLLVFITLAGTIFIMPFFLEWVLHYPIQRAGMLLAAIPIFGGIAAPVSGNLSDRFGTRITGLTGLLLMMIGCLGISTFHAQMTDLGYVLRVAPFGIGIGIFQSPNNSAILSEVPPERLGITSGLLSLTRTLGQVLGLPLMASLFSVLTLSQTTATDITAAPPDAIVHGIQGAFHGAALIMLMAVMINAKGSRVVSQRSFRDE